VRNQFAFLQLSDSIEGIVLLPQEVKEKKSPFIIVNTDCDRGLYIKKLELEIAKYKGLKSADGETKFHGISTSELIVFGDNLNYDYRVDMNYLILNTLKGRDVQVFDLVDDYSKIVKKLANYCTGNGIKRKAAYREFDLNLRFNIGLAEEPKKSCCPFFRSKHETPKVERALVNIYADETPSWKVEDVTVHTNWVKIGYNSYDILVNLYGEEFILLEDGQKMFVKTDRFGRRYLAA